MERKRHIILENVKDSQTYKPHTGGTNKVNLPERDRSEHAKTLLSSFSQIEQQDQKKEHQRNGRYVEFSSSGNFDLVFGSLERKSKKRENSIELLNTKIEENKNGEKITKATVYIPYGKENVIKNKIIKYNEEVSEKTGLPRHNNLILGIDNIELAKVEDFWTDNIDMPDVSSRKEWFEIWLNIEDDNEKENNKQIFIGTLNNGRIKYKKSYLQFPENLVMIIQANKSDLEYIVEYSDYLSEIKLVKEISTIIGSESKFEQEEWSNELLSRVKVNPDPKSRVFILDTGVNEGNPLLADIVDKKDSVEPAWGDYDHEGHGTEMAGVVAYGNLLDKISSSDDIFIEHKLGTVKILPKDDKNEKELWGDITKRAVAKAEIISPHIPGYNINSYCMAITTDDTTNTGRPSSWSSSIDQIIYNEGNESKNILISTGNSGIHNEDYPDYCSLSEVEDPAQSWNAITIGGYTEKSTIVSKEGTFFPMAKNGEMSPHNRTSLNFGKGWPIKPEIVFEGGNLLKGGEQNSDLELLTTNKDFSTEGSFTYFWGTSLSTALAGNFLGILSSKYPELSAETIRGLLIHSAYWTDEMLSQFGIKNIKTEKKENISYLIKNVGYGVPNLEKAIYSKENSLSIIIEETIQPYKKSPNKNNATLNEIHFYELPWPKQELEDLGNTEVKMKVTLSYFIEPSPGEKGWKNKYKYQSHSLRFDLNHKLESKEDFQKRLNLEARNEEEDYESSTGSGSERWIIGSNSRNNGTVRSDIWIGTAIELANCNLLAVIPNSGWWKERPSEQKTNSRTKYSLIVSLETKETEVELYTTIQNKIRVPIEIET